MADAIAYYLKDKSTADAEYRARAFILPELGEIRLADLTTEKIREWHRDIARQAPRVRTKDGEKQKHRKTANDDEPKRRRKSSANRILTILKAALNHCWSDGKISFNDAWRRVKPFKGVDAARVRYLQKDETRRLVNAADQDLRPLMQAALLTGARYSELARLRAEDFNDDSGTVAVRKSKTATPRHVILNDEGIRFFRNVCAGRQGDELLFTRNGRAWGQSEQIRPIRNACLRAKISPPISIHGLRHTYASLAIMNKAPLMVVAKNPPGEYHRSRQQRHRQDPHRSRARARGLSEGAVSWFLYRRGSRP